MTDPSLHVWNFTPVAAADDPTWQGRKIWRRFEIVAGTAGQAIALAAVAEQRLKGLDPLEDSQDHQGRRSGFENPRLYRLDRGVTVAGHEAGHVLAAE